MWFVSVCHLVLGCHFAHGKLSQGPGNRSTQHHKWDDSPETWFAQSISIFQLGRRWQGCREAPERAAPNHTPNSERQPLSNFWVQTCLTQTRFPHPEIGAPSRKLSLAGSPAFSLACGSSFSGDVQNQPQVKSKSSVKRRVGCPSYSGQRDAKRGSIWEEGVLFRRRMCEDTITSFARIKDEA